MKSEQNFSVIKQDGTIIDMHEIGVWVESFHIHSPNIYRNKLKIPNMPGAYLANSTEEERKVSIVMQLESENLKEFDQLKHQIYDVFFSEEDFTITRDLTPDREIHVLQEGDFDIANITPSDGYFEIELTMLDPYVYSKEKSAIFPSDTVTLTNHGTAEADPIFEMEVLQPVTFAMIQNHKEEYQMIGRPVDVDSVPFNEMELIKHDTMSNTTGWTTAAQVDNGVVSGTMVSDGNKFIVSNFGSSSEGKWYGPALKTSLPEQLQDFRMDALVNNLNGNDKVGRVDLYLLDANSHIIGSIRIVDAWENIKRNRGRAYIQNGTKQHHLINLSDVSDSGEIWNDFDGILRLERIGTKWLAYIGKIREDGTHHARRIVRFDDVAQDFMTRVAQIQIHIGKFGPYEHSQMSVKDLKVWKINNPEDNQIPYIAYLGDIITFDHKGNDILINGESRKDLKNFGGSFFKLEKGMNQLIVQPGDSFNTKGKYRERFR